MPLIREGLMRQYFDVETAQEFKDALLIDPDTLPLPVTPPYFMPDGFHVVYQQYEIACYAAGLPGCVLPYDSVALCSLRPPRPFSINNRKPHREWTD